MARRKPIWDRYKEKNCGKQFDRDYCADCRGFNICESIKTENDSVREVYKDTHEDIIHSYDF